MYFNPEGVVTAFSKSILLISLSLTEITEVGAAIASEGVPSPKREDRINNTPKVATTTKLIKISFIFFFLNAKVYFPNPVPDVLVYQYDRAIRPFPIDEVLPSLAKCSVFDVLRYFPS